MDHNIEFDLALGWILIETITNMAVYFTAYRSCCSEWLNEMLYSELMKGYENGH